MDGNLLFHWLFCTWRSYDCNFRKADISNSSCNYWSWLDNCMGINVWEEKMTDQTQLSPIMEVAKETFLEKQSKQMRGAFHNDWVFTGWERWLVLACWVWACWSAGSWLWRLIF